MGPRPVTSARGASPLVEARAGRGCGRGVECASTPPPTSTRPQPREPGSWSRAGARGPRRRDRPVAGGVASRRRLGSGRYVFEVARSGAALCGGSGMLGAPLCGRARNRSASPPSPPRPLSAPWPVVSSLDSPRLRRAFAVFGILPGQTRSQCWTLPEAQPRVPSSLFGRRGQPLCRTCESRPASWPVRCRARA